MNIGTRVALKRQPGLIGSIDGVKNGVADITFEGGGHGRFPLDDLQLVGADVPVNKTWPPVGLETKAAM
jgi:hypothetical protein